MSRYLNDAKGNSNLGRKKERKRARTTSKASLLRHRLTILGFVQNLATIPSESSTTYLIYMVCNNLFESNFVNPTHDSETTHPEVMN